MKILMISPEITPFSKAGGLGDAVAALAKNEALRGHEVRVFTPLYGSISKKTDWVAYPDPVRVELGYGMYSDCRIWNVPYAGVTISFLEYNHFFGENNIYSSRADDAYRFAFFNKAAIDFCEQANWIPDVIHCHDWTTGFVPAILNTRDRWRRIAHAGIIFTIHNLQHQGFCTKNILDYLGLPWSLFKSDNYECLGSLNMMKGALYHSTKITTVSPTYANEIKTPEYGFGLDNILRFRAADLIGIINGIDYQEWSPKTDPLISCKYSAEDFSGKTICKANLQQKMGLPEIPNIPVFGIISRLYDQKGLDILAQIVPELLSRAEMQICLLGSGDPALENNFKQLVKMFPSKIAVQIGYNNNLAHEIEAGADFFIMPSRFEPCGLNQMYSMAYGTPPIVRTTGGLIDTVSTWTPDIPGKGTGINFQNADKKGLLWAIERALQLYYDYPTDYIAVRKNGMKQNFSWEKSAAEYENIYKAAIETRKGAFPEPIVEKKPKKKIKESKKNK